MVIIPLTIDRYIDISPYNPWFLWIYWHQRILTWGAQPFVGQVPNAMPRPNVELDQCPGWWLKNDGVKVSWDDDIPIWNIWKVIKMYKHVPKHQPNVSIEWHISHVYRRGFQDSISGTYPKCDYWVDVHSWTNRLDTNVSGLQNTIWLFFIPWVGWHFKTIRRILLSEIQYLWIYLTQFKQYIQIYKGLYISKSRLYSSAFWCFFKGSSPLQQFGHLWFAVMRIQPWFVTCLTHQQPKSKTFFL